MSDRTPPPSAVDDDASTSGRASLRDRVDAVVIGASAGGVEALLKVLPGLPRDLRAPILVVLHLPRERPSMLADVFRTRCAMPVREAEDKMPIEAGTIYFAPSDYHLLVDRGPTLALSADELVNWSRPSIDILFESAVDVYGTRLAGIVLTGANDDGAAGLAAVHRAGGVAIVQDPAEAMVRAMPSAALARVDAQHVTTLAGIAALLKTLGDAAPAGPAA